MGWSGPISFLLFGLENLRINCIKTACFQGISASWAYQVREIFIAVRRGVRLLYYNLIKLGGGLPAEQKERS